MTSQFETCSLMSATSLIAKKWIGFIFCQLFEYEKMYFNELKSGINTKSTSKITASALSQTLKSLEEESIIVRQIDEVFQPPRVYYYLTEKGKELRIILAQIKTWAMKWESKTNSAKNCCVIEFLPEIKIKLDKI